MADVCLLGPGTPLATAGRCLLADSAPAAPRLRESGGEQHSSPSV